MAALQKSAQIRKTHHSSLSVEPVSSPPRVCAMFGNSTSSLHRRVENNTLLPTWASLLPSSKVRKRRCLQLLKVPFSIVRTLFGIVISSSPLFSKQLRPMVSSWKRAFSEFSDSVRNERVLNIARDVPPSFYDFESVWKAHHLRVLVKA